MHTQASPNLGRVNRSFYVGHAILRSNMYQSFQLRAGGDLNPGFHYYTGYLIKLIVRFSQSNYPKIWTAVWHL